MVEARIFAVAGSDEFQGQRFAVQAWRGFRLFPEMTWPARGLKNWLDVADKIHLGLRRHAGIPLPERNQQRQATKEEETGSSYGAVHSGCSLASCPGGE